jgi:hypothetical protein
VDLILLGGTDRSESIDLVEEDYGGLGGTGFVKEETELAFGFTDPFGETVGTFTHEECFVRGEEG